MRLQHVSIPVPRQDRERARAFYGGLLGLEERDVLPQLDPDRFIWFRLGGDVELHLLLVDEAGGEQGHFCLALEGGLERLRGELERAGVATREGTEIVGRPRFTCRDPAGNLVELAQIQA
jgi:catechol 2,3-dioxygenase-like lactoylglutathione lyase family enzyme